jgi:hypothetical protein
MTPLTSLILAAGISLASASVKWYDALSLGVAGRAFESNDGPLTFARWPAAAQADLNSGEWQYGLDSAGMFVQFSSNATSVSVNYTLRNNFVGGTPFANLSPISASGVDLYAFDDTRGSWRWIASAFDGLSQAAKSGRVEVVENPLFANSTGWPVGPVPRDASWTGTTRFRLHFPQYNGVLSLAVGVPLGASLLPDLSWNFSAPVIYLGTSITQGGVTERPGQAYVARLSSTLPRPVTNYGLCGSCRLEPGLAKWLVSIPRVPAVLVIGCTENMDVAGVTSNTAPFVRAVRAAWGADLPIALVEPIDDSPSWLQGNSTYQRPALRAALRASYEALVAGGDTALYYVNASTLRVGADDSTEEWTYEGVHPLDRGHALIAANLHNVIAPLLDAAPVERRRLLSTLDELSASWPPSALQAATALKSTITSELYTPPPPDADVRAASLTWTDASALTVKGRAWQPSDLPSPYARLPSAAHGVVTDAVWSLSLQSAGIAVAFESDAPEVWVNYTLASAVYPMVHFPATGISGADLWAFDTDTQKWRFVAAASMTIGPTNVMQQLTRPNVNVTSPGSPLKWLLFVATYNSVLSISIGTPSGSAIGPSEPFTAGARPVIWYGTSILQGGVTVKVGNIETARVSTALNREVYNFGFSGNCHFDISVAQFLLQIEDPAALIVDCMWNVDGSSIQNNTVAFVQHLRAHGLPATTPVILAEGSPQGKTWAVPSQRESQVQDNAYLRAAFNALVSEGDTALFYVNTSQLFSDESVRDSATAAGLHATDAGMHDMAAVFIDLLPKIMS